MAQRQQLQPPQGLPQDASFVSGNESAIHLCSTLPKESLLFYLSQKENNEYHLVIQIKMDMLTCNCESCANGDVFVRGKFTGTKIRNSTSAEDPIYIPILSRQKKVIAATHAVVSFMVAGAFFQKDAENQNYVIPAAFVAQLKTALHVWERWYETHGVTAAHIP